jgi:diadenosine tetraphosphate (Ap4A) HIT family hydrolase
VSGCYSCERNKEAPERLPPRECVYDDGLWRVAHAFSSSLAGWMCVVSHRHLTSLSQLSTEESGALGPLLQRLTAALEAATGATKCYVLFLSESPGFEHLHIHVVPRSADMPADRIGPAAFAYLNDPPERWLPPAEMDRIATNVSEALTADAPQSL